jgi:hypothetical protein
LSNGACEQVGIFRNPQTDDGGFGAYPKLMSNSTVPDIDPNLSEDIDNSLLEKEEDVTIEWTSPAQTYDVRGRKDLGQTSTVKTKLDPWSALVYTRAPQPLAALRVEVRGARAGEMAETVLTGEGPLPDGTFRVVRLEFRTPAGDSYDLYARNVMLHSSPYVERIPFAVNDPKGNWRVVAHDLGTGQVVEAPFELA